ncbi:MAG: RNA polymerase sporulation sigma factor SigF [Defluviitaleaceae bacterium]|nr:RNA polymerase sporulation sigma factor SigF [Defluviitaleaceae bacterium]MCL2238994.1 RNA polymerase sporulation sigma factor SigF [Defluviitaleaceae bacterium]
MELDAKRALIARAQQGDEAAVEQLIRENSGLVWSVVKKFSKRGYELDDLYQIGAIGLLKCIRKFDLGFDVKFSTYAIPMIIGEIKRFLRDDGIIKVSRPIKELAAKARYVQEALTAKLNRTPTLSELAKEINVETEELVVAMEAGLEVESLYTTIYQGDGSPIYLIDKVSQGQDAGEQTVNILALKQLIGRLKPKERQVIILRYFQDKTQMEVAKAIGVSQVQVSRIEKRVLQTLREGLTAE